MVVGEAVIVAGLGSRKGVTEAEVLAAIDGALASYGLTREKLDRLATAPLKGGEAALHEASAALGIVLTIVDDAALEKVSGRTLTHSALSAAKAGTPSVSEASALAAAGDGSRLFGPRVVVGPVTCAIAMTEGSASPSPLRGGSASGRSEAEFASRGGVSAAGFDAFLTSSTSAATPPRSASRIDPPLKGEGKR